MGKESPSHTVTLCDWVILLLQADILSFTTGWFIKTFLFHFKLWNESLTFYCRLTLECFVVPTTMKINYILNHQDWVNVLKIQDSYPMKARCWIFIFNLCWSENFFNWSNDQIEHSFRRYILVQFSGDKFLSNSQEINLVQFQEICPFQLLGN